MQRDSRIDFVCLCVYLTSFLTFFFPYFLLSLCFLSYLFTSLLIYFLTYLSTPSRIDPIRFQAGDRRRWPNLALVFCLLILCCSICCGCMFALLVCVFVFQYYAKRLAGKNVSRMTYFVSCWTWNLNSVYCVVFMLHTCTICRLLFEFCIYAFPMFYVKFIF